MEQGKVVRKLPMNLGDALERLNGDDIIKAALPGEMLHVFNHYKQDEWERFMATATEWDLRTYLDYLP
jgi:glutamine synthetase